METYIALAASAIGYILKMAKEQGVDPAAVLAKVQTDADAELGAIPIAERIALAREAAARPAGSSSR